MVAGAAEALVQPLAVAFAPSLDLAPGVLGCLEGS
jgi:hypothetical protein